MENGKLSLIANIHICDEQNCCTVEVVININKLGDEAYIVLFTSQPALLHRQGLSA
jgi:hypothetical protein